MCDMRCIALVAAIGALRYSRLGVFPKSTVDEIQTRLFFGLAGDNAMTGICVYLSSSFNDAFRQAHARILLSNMAVVNGEPRDDVVYPSSMSECRI